MSNPPTSCRPAALVALTVLTTLMISGCGPKNDSPTSSNSTTSQNPIGAPLDYVGAVGKAKKSAEKVIDTASMARQIQLFYAAEGHYPADLAELVREKYMPSIPPAPHGMKYVYNPTTGDIKIIKQ